MEGVVLLCRLFVLALIMWSKNQFDLMCIIAHVCVFVVVLKTPQEWLYILAHVSLVAMDVFLNFIYV